jgi:ribosome-associated toxin RatA of RatAB toxin-antitoxin module
VQPVEVTVRVERPAPEVFAVVSDVRNNPRWQGGMVSCEWTSPPPRGLGATYDQTARFLGRDIVSRFVVDEFEPGRVIRVRTVQSPFPIVETRRVEPEGGSACRVTAIVGGDASGFFAIAGPLLRLMVARSVRSDYRRLARMLEASEIGG